MSPAGKLGKKESDLFVGQAFFLVFGAGVCLYLYIAVGLWRESFGLVLLGYSQVVPSWDSAAQTLL